MEEESRFTGKVLYRILNLDPRKTADENLKIIDSNAERYSRRGGITYKIKGKRCFYYIEESAGDFLSSLVRLLTRTSDKGLREQ